MNTRILIPVLIAALLTGCTIPLPTARSDKGGIYLNLSADAVLIEPVLAKQTQGVSREEALRLSSRTEIVDALNRYVDAYKGSQVQALFLNINYQRACFDSKVMESYWNLPDPEKEITEWYVNRRRKCKEVYLKKLDEVTKELEEI